MKKSRVAVLFLSLTMFFLSDQFASVLAKNANSKQEKAGVAVTHEQCQARQCYEGWMIDDSARIIAINEACDRMGEKELKKTCQKEPLLKNWELITPAEKDRINTAVRKSQERVDARAQTQGKFVINGETYK